MTPKKPPAKPVVPIVTTERATIRTYRIKATTFPYSYAEDKTPEDAGVALADLMARVDAIERCGLSPRMSVNDERTTLTLYVWRPKTP